MPEFAPLPRDETARALEAADLRVLLMVMNQLTGDAKWLAPPFAPRRDVRLIAKEHAGLDEEAQAELRAAALEALTSGPITPAFHDPGDEKAQEMMSACLGERVPAEYAPMMREEMGFAPRWLPPPSGRRPAAPVLIVGAGPSGLALGAQLQAMEIPFVILERNASVGGTWYENRYPGCAVDTPNHAYSFSFGRRHDWRRYFSRQPDLLAYLRDRAAEFGLDRVIRFNTRLTEAAWDEDARLWRAKVEGPDGPEYMAACALVSAIGPLSLPNRVRFPGDDSFRGPIFHSAEWPEGLEVAGKRIAVIGTGASSMQITPTLAPVAERLTVYQRTPQWARHIPRFQDDMAEENRWLLRHVPYYAEWFRFTMLWRYGDGLLRTLRRDPDWPHFDRSMNRINDKHREEMANHILSELEGRPDLIEKAMPDYPPYGKRILLDNGWFRTLRRDNVDLVTDAVERITPTGVVAGGEERPADIIVLATGFNVNRSAARLNLTGRGGVSLSDQWAGDDPKAYLGVTVPNFPNLFVMQGPGTGLAHGGSAIFTSECQARYICGCLSAMIEGGFDAMEVRAEVHDAYMERLDAEHAELIWAHPGLTTYYRNSAGRVTSIMPWRLVDYYGMTKAPDLKEYLVAKGRSGAG